MVKYFCLFLLLVGAGISGLEARVQIVWPTPNPAYANGEGPEAFIQPTISGRVESGRFGCIRNSGARFHEALALKPIARDRRREATDPVVAGPKGAGVYVNRIAGSRGYARYVVIARWDVSPSLVSF